jgi:hypothetical protein
MSPTVFVSTANVLKYKTVKVGTVIVVAPASLNGALKMI